LFTPWRQARVLTLELTGQINREAIDLSG
jgi:hypothetical protein